MIRSLPAPRPLEALRRAPRTRPVLATLFALGVAAALAPPAAAQSALWTDTAEAAYVEVDAVGDLVALIYAPEPGPLPTQSAHLRILRLEAGFSAPVLEHAQVLDGIQPAVVALGPDHALVGDPGWENNYGFDRGRVLVLRRQPATGLWGTVQVLYPPVLGNVRFGTRVAVDGDRALVATGTGGTGVGTGHAFAYGRDPVTGQWSLEQELVPDYFPETNVGHDVALDGDVAILGDPRDTFPTAVGHGRVSVWRRGPGGVWDQEAVLGPPSATSSFGRRVAVSGDDLVVLDRYSGLSGISPQPGRAFHFRRTNGTWVLTQVLSEAAGTAPMHPLEVALDGDTLVLTDDASLSGFDDPELALVLRRPDAASPFQPVLEFTDQATPNLGGFFGYSVALEQGRLWVGERDDLVGTPAAHLLNPNDGMCDGFQWDSDRIDAGAEDFDQDGVPDVCQLLGTVECVPDPNYQPGSLTALLALGSDQAADNDLDLKVFAGPPGAWGYALASTASATLPLYGGSSGLLCLEPGPALHRLTDHVAPFDGLGQALVPVDLTSLPDGLGGTGVQPGDTWYFQYWYRVGFESYYSNSLSIAFQ